MRPIFPTFHQPYLQSTRLCGCFPLGDTELSRIIKQIEGKAGWRETRYESKRGSAWMRARISRRPEYEEPSLPEGRLQVECALESVLRSHVGTEPQNTTEEVQEYLTLFSQQELAIVCCSGLFYVPQEKIPKRGFVGLMLDISAKVSKAEMNITGATFDIQGCAPYEELRWKQRVISANGAANQTEVEIMLTASPEDAGIGGAPRRVAKILDTGLRELVLETEK